MILLFEGVDCVGKTSLVNGIISEQTIKINYNDHFILLERLRNINVIPSNRTYEIDKFSIMTELTYLKALHDRMNLILDRSYFSHYVYALTRRGYELNFIKEVDKELSLLDVKLFLITADFDILKNRLIKEHDEISLKNIVKESNLMFRLYNRSLIKSKYVIKNNNGEDFNNNINEILSVIEE